MTRSRETLLNVLTAAIAVAALLVLIESRLAPAVADRSRVDPGDAVHPPVLLRSLSTGDTLAMGSGDPQLVVVFQSTCAVCEQVAPAWRALAARSKYGVVGIGLEPDSAAAEWLAEQLPVVVPVAPLDRWSFLDRFRIRAVPTTLLLAEGRLRLRRVGPLEVADRSLIEKVLRGRDTSARDERGTP